MVLAGFKPQQRCTLYLNVLATSCQSQSSVGYLSLSKSRKAKNLGGYIAALKHRELLSVVCGHEAVKGGMGTMLWWVSALLCHQGCCEVCGRCESFVWKECRLCHPQEALQNHCHLPAPGACCPMGTHGVSPAAVTWKGQPSGLGKGRGIALGSIQHCCMLRSLQQ